MRHFQSISTLIKKIHNKFLNPNHLKIQQTLQYINHNNISNQVTETEQIQLYSSKKNYTLNTVIYIYIYIYPSFLR